jgi:hypothetical protein|tara:strand:+ start:689 stop:850 length:162 start_codon:yes stop_codon:yes gene_type:complete
MINNLKQLIIRLEREVHKDLKRLCLEKDIPVQRFIKGFIQREIEKFKKKGGKS